MTVEHDREKAVKELFASIHDTDAAESFLSDTERELLSRYNETINELYPDGIPSEQSEQILQAIASEFPELDDIISKIFTQVDEMRRVRNSNKLQ